jgi:hypothetical protein
VEGRRGMGLVRGGAACFRGRTVGGGRVRGRCQCWWGRGLDGGRSGRCWRRGIPDGLPRRGRSSSASGPPSCPCPRPRSHQQRGVGVWVRVRRERELRQQVQHLHLHYRCRRREGDRRRRRRGRTSNARGRSCGERRLRWRGWRRCGEELRGCARWLSGWRARESWRRQNGSSRRCSARRRWSACSTREKRPFSHFLARRASTPSPSSAASRAPAPLPVRRRGPQDPLPPIRRPILRRRLPRPRSSNWRPQTQRRVWDTALWRRRSSSHSPQRSKSCTMVGWFIET